MNELRNQEEQQGSAALNQLFRDFADIFGSKAPSPDRIKAELKRVKKMKKALKKAKELQQQIQIAKTLQDSDRHKTLGYKKFYVDLEQKATANLTKVLSKYDRINNYQQQ